MTYMPGNANTKKTDEVENLKFSGVSTENTIWCNLLLTLDIWRKASYPKKHSILLYSFNIYPFTLFLQVYTRTSLLYMDRGDVYADDICKSIVTDTYINYPKYDKCCSLIMNVHALILLTWGICLYPICCLVDCISKSFITNMIRLDIKCLD